jgi:hypothetical protein
MQSHERDKVAGASCACTRQEQQTTSSMAATCLILRFRRKRHGRGRAFFEGLSRLCDELATDHAAETEETAAEESKAARLRGVNGNAEVH